MKNLTDTFPCVYPSERGDEREVGSREESASLERTAPLGGMNTPSTMSDAEHARINQRAILQIEAAWQRHYGFPFDSNPFG